MTKMIKISLFIKELSFTVKITQLQFPTTGGFPYKPALRFFQSENIDIDNTNINKISIILYFFS